jgi:prephenate dehydrogenase
MRVAMLGLGLIGGSVARALALVRPDPPVVFAWSPRGDGPAAAAREGVVSRAVRSPEEAITGADLVILAAPATACLTLLDGLGGSWRGAVTPETVVTDVASTKGAIVARARARGVRFVGGHPMTGREMDGFDASTADLFIDRPWVVVPAAEDDVATGRVEDLARLMGARPVRMDAATHDSIVAAISHLPLVVAASLVEAVAGGREGVRPDWADAAGLAANGWRDSTRVARGDPAMGASIAATNAPAIASRLRDMIRVLESWAIALEDADGPDEDRFAARLRVARDRLAENGL